MEKKISPMAVLGTLGPMIGLLGTLSGMIRSFGEIARSAGQPIKSDRVAKGISEALLLTFEGRGAFLARHRVLLVLPQPRVGDRVTTMTRADEFLRHFAQAARGKPADRPAASRGPHEAKGFRQGRTNPQCLVPFLAAA